MSTPPLNFQQICLFWLVEYITPKTKPPLGEASWADSWLSGFSGCKGPWLQKKQFLEKRHGPKLGSQDFLVFRFFNFTKNITSWGADKVLQA